LSFSDLHQFPRRSLGKPRAAGGTGPPSSHANRRTVGSEGMGETRPSPESELSTPRPGLPQPFPQKLACPCPGLKLLCRCSKARRRGVRAIMHGPCPASPRPGVRDIRPDGSVGPRVRPLGRGPVRPNRRGRPIDSVPKTHALCLPRTRLPRRNRI
jgi:hypothetical protein